MGLLATLKRIALRPFDRGDYTANGERRVENTDALAAAGSAPGRLDPQGGTGHVGAPPNYVPPADEGRPRH